jgi:hypothetical protein
LRLKEVYICLMSDTARWWEFVSCPNCARLEPLAQ